jgi:hypothetical protein
LRKTVVIIDERSYVRAQGFKGSLKERLLFGAQGRREARLSKQDGERFFKHLILLILYSLITVSGLELRITTG